MSASPAAVEVERWDPARDGPLTEAALRAAIEARGFVVERHDYPTGTRVPAHSHPEDKMSGVLAGRLRMTVAGRTVVLEPGDRLYLPAGTVHDAKVVGDAPLAHLDATPAGGTA